MTAHVVMVWHRRHVNLWQGYCACGKTVSDHDRDVVETEMADCRAQAPTPKNPSKEHQE